MAGVAGHWLRRLAAVPYHSLHFQVSHDALRGHTTPLACAPPSFALSNKRLEEGFSPRCRTIRSLPAAQSLP